MVNQTLNNKKGNLIMKNFVVLYQATEDFMAQSAEMTPEEREKEMNLWME
jgi:hypothetical protein